MKRIINHQQQNRSEGLTSTFPKNGKKMFKIFRRCKVLLVNTSEHHFTMPKSPRLCKCCAKTVSKKIKCLKIRHLTLAFVGITGLEPATSRPPDVCATNCAKSRFCDAKVYTFDDNSKLLSEIFLKNSKNVLFSMLLMMFCLFTRRLQSTREKSKLLPF